MAEQSIRIDDLALVVPVSENEEEKDESAKMMESNIYPRQLMEHLNSGSLVPTFPYCDFTIHVGYKEFPVHQTILAARSEYFDVMFTSKMKEAVEKQVAMKDIAEDCMKWILDFLYSGKINFSLKNIKGIIQSAALMQIQELLDLATEYVVQVLSPQNCFPFFQIGKLHLMDDLANAAKKYLLSHFGEAAQQDWFVDLDFQDLEMFLSSQEVVVINEEKVFEALMRWLKHDLDSRKEYFPTLFQHIRLSALPLKYIENVIRKENFLYEFRSCNERVLQHYYLVGSKINIEANPRKGLLPDSNMGFIAHGVYNHIDINPSENKFQLREVEKVKKKVRRDFSSSILSSCVHGNNGYVCDQYNLYCFDGKGKTIAELPDNFECQYMVYIDLIEVQSVRGFRSARPTTRASLFLLGKIISRNERTYQIYKFDIENKQFNEVETCFTPWRPGASVVAVEGKMYIMGGYLYRHGSSDIKTASDLVDILNLNGWPSWEIGQNLNIPRADFAAAQLRSRIYSFGGFGKNNERLTSGEFMDLSDGVWNKLTNDVPLPLGSASAFCVGDHIAVYEKGETLKKIFLFNSFNEEWVVLENVKKVEHVSMKKGGRWKKVENLFFYV